MELLDLYVSAVGDHLPRKNRADIEAEIRSILQDMLEDRSQQEGRPVDDTMLKDVLRAYGSPEKVAATYRPERYLVGPRLYPLFILVCQIAFGVLTALALVGWGIGLLAGASTITGGTLLRVSGQAALEYLRNLIAALGNIVLVFAILERLLPESSRSLYPPSFERPELRAPEGAKGRQPSWAPSALGAPEGVGQAGIGVKGAQVEWDPASLMKQPRGQTVHLWRPVSSIVFTCAWMLVFNFYPQLIGFTPSLNNLGSGAVVFIPILSEDFYRYLPWLNLVGLATIAMNVVLLRAGYWSPATRWLSIGVKALGLVLLGALLVGPLPLRDLRQDLLNWPVDPATASLLSTMLAQLVQGALVVVMVILAAEIITELYRLIVTAARREKPLAVK